MATTDVYWAMARQPEPPAGFTFPGERPVGSLRPFGDRVLVTEDNWLIAGEWEAALEAAGYTIVGLAVTADEAVTMARQERPDFILMDIRLLGPRDGIEAATDIRRTLGIPSVFISAHDDAETRARAELAQPIGWVVKPVMASRLADLLAQLADGRN